MISTLFAWSTCLLCIATRFLPEKMVKMIKRCGFEAQRRGLLANNSTVISNLLARWKNCVYLFYPRSLASPPTLKRRTCKEFIKNVLTVRLRAEMENVNCSRRWKVKSMSMQILSRRKSWWLWWKSLCAAQNRIKMHSWDCEREIDGDGFSSLSLKQLKASDLSSLQIFMQGLML